MAVERVTAQGMVKSADRTLSVLEYLAISGGGCTLSRIAADLEMPKSSLLGLLRTLHAHRWVSTDQTGRLFSLGVRALLVGASYVATDDVVQLAGDELDALSDELRETIHLGRINGDQVVYLAKRDAEHPLRLMSGVGVRLPAHATALGKALLAERTPADVCSILPKHPVLMTADTITGKAELLRELETVRTSGHAVDRGESTAGVWCFAVTIGPSTPSDYAISCSVPLARLDEEVTARVLDALQRTRDVLATHSRLAQVIEASQSDQRRAT